MDLDCDTIFVKVYDFDRISRISLVPPVLRWFSRTKKEEVIWPVPARLCLDYLREWEWRASESTLFLHMLLSSSADMPDCQLGCKSMKWAQVLTMTEKEQKVQLTAGNRRFPEKINSMSIKTLSPGPLPKWPKWPMLWDERRPKLNLKVDSTGSSGNQLSLGRSGNTRQIQALFSSSPPENKCYKTFKFPI